MPSTPVRDIELIEVGSLGKETLSNDSFTNLSLGISGAATIPLSSTDHTLTTTNDGEAMRFVLILTGTLTANVNLLVPAESRVYVVDNRTTGAFTVTCRPAAGGGVAVDQSARTLIYCDGSNVYPVASGTGGGGGGSGAPTDASYLVGASHTLLSGERVVTDTATVTWDLGTPGQARAVIPPDAISYAHIQNVAPTRLLGRFTAGAGDVQEITPGTGLTLDAGGVLSATAVGQPLDATLTALAGLTTGANLLPYFTGVDTVTTTTLSAFVRTLLDDADAAAVRGTISAQASDATLTALAGVTTGADTLPFFTGVDTASTTVLTAFMRGLLDDPDLATAQATLGITGGGGYTDEQAQDAVGTILTDSPRIDFTYTDATPAISADIVAGSITETQIGLSDVTADNATTAQHGFLPKLSGTSTTYLDGTGAWTTPAGGGGGAPTDAEYIVGSASPTLTQERVLTATPTVSWDLSTPGQAKAVVPDASLTEAKFSLSDVTTANASTTAHGLLRKLSGTATEYLNGTGAWSTPAGGGALDPEAVQDIVGAMLSNTTTVQLAYIDATGQFQATVPNGSITEAKLGFGDTTTADSTVVGHGLLRKLNGNTAHFLRGDGAWAAPAAATDTEAVQDIVGAMLVDSSSINFTYNDAANTVTADVTPALGTMATQNASAVAIMGGAISIGGHAPTGVLDVQGSVVMSDNANCYVGVRVWPVAPSGASLSQGLRIEPTTGAGLAGTGILAVEVVDQPTAVNVQALRLNMTSGTNRYNVYASGNAQNYFAGNVGIANATPSYPLDVTGDVRVMGSVGIGKAPSGHLLELFYNRAAQQCIIVTPNADTGGGVALLFNNAAGAGVGSISTTASATAFNTSSDVRLKHSIAPLTGSLDVITALRPVRFRWNADESVGHGFLAHELQQVVPEAVTGEPDAVNDDGSVRPQGVDHSRLVPWLVAALQATMEQVAQLTARVGSLEQQLGL